MGSFRLISCAILSTLCLLAESPTEWKQGKVVDFTTGTVSRVVRGNEHISTKNQKQFTISVDGGDQIYAAEEVTRRMPHVQSDSQIKYAVSKNYLYVRELDGKVHKLALIRTTWQK